MASAAGRPADSHRRVLVKKWRGESPPSTFFAEEPSSDGGVYCEKKVMPKTTPTSATIGIKSLNVPFEPPDFGAALGP